MSLQVVLCPSKLLIKSNKILIWRNIESWNKQVYLFSCFSINSKWYLFSGFIEQLYILQADASKCGCVVLHITYLFLHCVILKNVFQTDNQKIQSFLKPYLEWK